ncbi:putative mucin TcMUCII [Trypanosoma cruzi]|uniref:Mucin TcMUCII, putative n=2 Tax=Trypanosoma cruzi TaxID=5693 RepID=Q4DRK5_TRYCC|nr:mucin TcMUCII, putative [Trypanosoma cruzi]EAN95151.1 mucin TcMUCII, putative [Trypanosoma cruzi]PWV21038.1 putative mucin TcMUCII [Trypanosoma cruzi]RNC38171.1 mucin TcMUCII [Trypanosoma cruzi]|eukprot:XP_817002.1 mucin TcMUCII [Trypanosoma cruzi strain CL Brener]
MMMTCRLLCALLVLALCCCCPSVCASAEPEPKVDVQASQTTTPTITQPQVTDDNAIVQAVGEAAGESPLLLEGAQGEGQSGPPTTPVTNPAAMLGGNGGSGPGATGTLQAADNDGTTGPQGSKGKPADQANENAEGGVDTTTAAITTHAADDEEKVTPDAEANTKVTSSLLPAPENSRPEAAEESATEPAPGNIEPETPSTTTTEAPAVSTTSAPSRLREIDGSLSSSAWVCAPLVLAASALAYTAVG